jgi:hypothetical protein
MARRTKRQHFLPQSYLKRFSNKEQVYVHNFQLGKSYVNNIKDAACIDDFYTVQTIDNKLDDSIEHEFLARFEGKANPIIEKIINEKCIPENKEKRVLCSYLALMYTRGLWFRQIYLEVCEHLFIELFDKLMTDEGLYNKTMENVKKEYGEESAMSFEKAKEMRHNFKVTANIARTYYVKEMMLTAAMFEDIFFDLNFNLLYISVYSSAKYITSDRPFVVMTNSKERKKWIEDSEAEIYFPLSSSKCLMLDFKESPIIREAQRHEVAFFNFHVANESICTAISQDKDLLWRNDDRLIRHSSEKLVELLSKDKKTKHRASESTGQEMRSKPRTDINLLKGEDEKN